MKQGANLAVIFNRTIHTHAIVTFVILGNLLPSASFRYKRNAKFLWGRGCIIEKFHSNKQREQLGKVKRLHLQFMCPIKANLEM